MNLNRCPTHPNYKGLRETKRDCKHCRLVFERSREANKKNFWSFPSLTTPGQSYSETHILAEISCIMLFGQQPPYFWRKDSSSSKAVKSHYQKMLMNCRNWSKKRYEKPIYGTNPIDTFKKILYYTVSKYSADENTRKIHDRVSIKKEDKKPEKPIETSYFDVGEVKKNKFESLKDLGNESDEVK